MVLHTINVLNVYAYIIPHFISFVTLFFKKMPQAFGAICGIALPVFAYVAREF